MIDLLVVGHITQEFIELPGRHFGPVLGGPAAYASMAAARLGARVGLVTVVGPDLPPGFLEPLEAAGVDLTGLRYKNGHTRANTLRYGAGGRKSLTHLRVASPIEPRDIPARMLPASAALACPMDFEVLPATLDALRRRSIRLGADLGGFGGAASSRRPSPLDPGHVGRLEHLLPLLDAAKASLEDCVLLRPRTRGSVNHARHLATQGARAVFITLGARGSLVWESGVPHRVPAIRVRCVDPTGAGDVYSAALMISLTRGLSAVQAAEYASAAASFIVETTGGVSLERFPSDAMVQRRLIEQGSDRSGSSGTLGRAASAESGDAPA